MLLDLQPGRLMWPVELLENRRLLTVYWVDPVSGSNVNAGTSADAFATITYALTQATAPGDVVNLRSGVYRGETAKFVASGVAANPITLQAAPGETPIVKGSRVVDGPWTLDGTSTTTYRTSWAFNFGTWNSAFTSTPQGSTSGMDARQKARNQFFVDGAILKEVPRRTDMSAGTFWVDLTTQSVCIRLSDSSDPTSHFVEGTDTQNALLRTDGKDYLTIRGITFMHDANAAQEYAAVRVDNSTVNTSNSSHDVTIDSCSVSWAAGAGLALGGSNNLALNCALNDNGQLGLHSTRSTNNIMRGGTLLRNDKHPNKKYDIYWEAGGCKVSYSTGFLMEGVEAGNNSGTGIWFDLDNQNATIRNNRSYGNLIGIHYEVSYTGTIYNNLCYSNRAQGEPQSNPVGRGIYISSSAGCKVIHNTFWDNDNSGIEVAGGDSRVDSLGNPINSYANQIFNNIVAVNAVGDTNNKNIAVRTNPPNLGNPIVPYSKNTSDYNVFWLPSSSGGGSRAFFSPIDGGSSVATLTSWRNNTGFDLHSVWGDPKFHNTSLGDFHLDTGTAALAVGTLRNEATIDRDSIIRTLGAIEAGGYQVARYPRVSGAQFLFQTTQAITLQFSEDLSATLSAGDLLLTNLTTGATAPVAINVVGAGATITFPAGLLDDGNYQLVIDSPNVTGASGLPLDGNGDGTGGDPYTFTFFVLAGDLNRNRTIDAADFATLAAKFNSSGATYSDGDVNYDGVVNAIDFNALATSFGKTLG